MDGRADKIPVQSPCVNLTCHILKGQYGLQHAQDAYFYFGHIQPRSMNWGIIDFQVQFTSKMSKIYSTSGVHQLYRSLAWSVVQI